MSWCRIRIYSIELAVTHIIHVCLLNPMEQLLIYRLCYFQLQHIPLIQILMHVLPWIRLKTSNSQLVSHKILCFWMANSVLRKLHLLWVYLINTFNWKNSVSPVWCMECFPQKMMEIKKKKKRVIWFGVKMTGCAQRSGRCFHLVVAHSNWFKWNCK